MRLEDWLSTMPLRMRSLLRRSHLDAELDEELRDHLDRQIEDNLARGMSEEAARGAALRSLGNPAVLRERTRAMWSWNSLEQWAHDLRIGARTLSRTPVFASIAILIMALGIGANVALFTVVRDIVLRPLPFADPGRLVMLYESKLHDRDAPGSSLVAGGVYDQWKKLNQTFTSLGLVANSRVQLSGSGRELPEKLSCALFSWDLLPTLGVPPALGRNFNPADDSPSAQGTVLLSWKLWQRRFGGDPAIIDRTVSIDAVPYTVIGVMPAWFSFPDASSQLWLPIGRERTEAQMIALSDHSLSVVGRLRPGVSQAQARADLSLISRHIHDANLSDPLIYTAANSRTLLDHLVGSVKQPLYILLAATFCVLLIACLNVSSLLVARAASRRRDLAVRTALGGGWGRLVRERLIESLLLCGCGGVLGLGLAAAALQWLVHTRGDIVRVQSVHLDLTVAAFALAVVTLCAVVAGLISVFGSRDKSILSVLRESSRAISGERSKTRLRRVVLAAELALTVVLLIGAGLLLRSYQRLRSSALGCFTANVLTLHTGLPEARYVTPAQRAGFYDTLLDRVRALPGVSTSGFANVLPGERYRAEQSFHIVGHPALAQAKGMEALNRIVDPGFFQAIGIPILSGRTFNPALRLADANEAVIDQTLVRDDFPGEDPIGKRIELNGRTYVIVGVAGATRFDIAEEPRPTLYLSMESGQASFGEIVVRSAQDPVPFGLPVQRIVYNMDSDLVVSDVLTMDQLIGNSTLDARFNATLLAGFASLSLILAAAGLFGVISFLVAQRMGEIGIRIALGAQRSHVFARMLMDGMAPVIFGLALGLAASVAAAQLLRGILYRTPALDPVVFVAVSALLLMVAVAACLLPVWRASRLDPMRVLRLE